MLLRHQKAGRSKERRFFLFPGYCFQNHFILLVEICITMKDTSKLHKLVSRSTKIALTIITLLMIIVSFTRLVDDQTQVRLNESMVAAGASFAIARSLDATISLVKSTEVSVGVASIDPGQVLNPLSDLIDKFSWVMTVAVGSLALQKILLTITSSTLANVLFALTALMFLVVLWADRAAVFKSAVVHAMKVIILVRFAVVASVGLSLIVDHIFLDDQIEASSSQIESVSKVVTGLAENNVENELNQAQQQGFLDSIKGRLSSFSSPAEKVSAINEKVESSILGFMNLIALFLFKTVLMPIGFLVFLKRMLMNARNFF